MEHYDTHHDCCNKKYHSLFSGNSKDNKSQRGAIWCAERAPEAPTPKYVDRNESGYLIASQMLAQWVSAGIFSTNSKPTAAAFNAVLEKAGFVVRAEGGALMPTATGIAAGIALYRGTSARGNEYVNTIYSPQAQAMFAGMVQRGELGL